MFALMQASENGRGHKLRCRSQKNGGVVPDGVRSVCKSGYAAKQSESSLTKVPSPLCEALFFFINTYITRLWLTGRPPTGHCFMISFPRLEINNKKNKEKSQAHKLPPVCLG